MRGVIAFVILLLIGNLFELNAQDFLQGMPSNPSLFHKGNFWESNEKLQIQEKEFVYLYDTIALPFIDDFSVDHFPKRISDESDPSVTDTTVYSVFLNGSIYRLEEGFTDDTSFTFSISALDSSVVQRIENIHSIIEFHTIEDFPTKKSTLRAYQPFDIYDTIGGGRDTVFKEVIYVSDSTQYFIVNTDSNNFYTDRSVLRNTTFAIDPPSIGVVTFDGLDEFGMPYDITDIRRVEADLMSSVPIDLSNLPDTQVFISFYYQPKGLSVDRPEAGDSLTLDFFSVDADRWTNVWRSSGFSSNQFQKEIIKVPNYMHRNGFRFRFRNFASSGGGFDHWHVDYIYLDNARNAGDTSFKDLSYVYDAEPILEEFTSMPWFHYRTNPSLYLRDTLPTRVVNNSEDELRVENKVVIMDTIADTVLYRYPPSNANFIFLSSKQRINFRYPLDFSYKTEDVDSAGVFEAAYDVRFNPGPLEEDFIRSNDTVIGKTVLDNYYAYDDGSAEAGYGVEAQSSPDGLFAFMAVEYNIPFSDTLGGVQLYFFPQTNDITKQTFELTVWSSLSPPTVIFTKQVLSKPIYTEDNAFLTYFFDSSIVVGQKFYVGMKSIGVNSLNIGYDLNTNTRNRIFWSQDGQTWNNPSAGIQDGSLMLRPIFRKKNFGVGLTEVSQRNNRKERKIDVYPNPSNRQIRINFESMRPIKVLEIIDVQGKTQYKTGAFTSSIRSGDWGFNSSGSYYQLESSVEVSEFKNGIYILRLIDDQGISYSRKFIVYK